MSELNQIFGILAIAAFKPSLPPLGDDLEKCCIVVVMTSGGPVFFISDAIDGDDGGDDN